MLVYRSCLIRNVHISSQVLFPSYQNYSSPRYLIPKAVLPLRWQLSHFELISFPTCQSGAELHRNTVTDAHTLWLLIPNWALFRCSLAALLPCKPSSREVNFRNTYSSYTATNEPNCKLWQLSEPVAGTFSEK